MKGENRMQGEKTSDRSIEEILKQPMTAADADFIELLSEQDKERVNYIALGMTLARAGKTA